MNIFSDTVYEIQDMFSLFKVVNKREVPKAAQKFFAISNKVVKNTVVKIPVFITFKELMVIIEIDRQSIAEPLQFSGFMF